MCSPKTPPAPAETGPPAPAAPPAAAPASAPLPNSPLGADSATAAALKSNRSGASAFKEKRNFVPSPIAAPLVGSGLNIPT